MQVKSILIRDIKKPQWFWVNISRQNSTIIKLKLKKEMKKITDYFKDLKKKGTIKSISKPVNKNIQDEIDLLVKLRKIADESIKKINSVFG